MTHDEQTNTGSWVGGNKNQHQLYNAVELLCNEGYAVVASEYRFSVSTFGYKKSTFPAQTNDTKATLQWIRRNATKYGLNSNSIGVWGASAGAQLAGLLGTVREWRKRPALFLLSFSFFSQ